MSARAKRFQHRLARMERSLLHAAKSVLQSSQCLITHKKAADVAFVAGVQRSGTNMLMDVLEQSFVTDVYHEWDARAFDNYQMRDQGYVRELWSACKAPHFIIKSLCELQYLSQLMETFAPAKTVWIVRNYNDVVNSMGISFSNQAQQVQRIARDRDSDGWQGRGMSDETHAWIKQRVHDAISDSSAAALIWHFRNQLFFDQGFADDPRVLLVRYESLVTEPVQEFSRVFDFLGVPYRPWHSRKVVAKFISKAAAPDIEAPIQAQCDVLMQRFDELRPLRITA